MQRKLGVQVSQNALIRIQNGIQTHRQHVLRRQPAQITAITLDPPGREVPPRLRPPYHGSQREVAQRRRHASDQRFVLPVALGAGEGGGVEGEVAAEVEGGDGVLADEPVGVCVCVCVGVWVCACVCTRSVW